MLKSLEVPKSRPSRSRTPKSQRLTAKPRPSHSKARSYGAQVKSQQHPQVTEPRSRRPSHSQAVAKSSSPSSVPKLLRPCYAQVTAKFPKGQVTAKSPDLVVGQTVTWSWCRRGDDTAESPSDDGAQVIANSPRPQQVTPKSGPSKVSHGKAIAAKAKSVMPKPPGPCNNFHPTGGIAHMVRLVATVPTPAGHCATAACCLRPTPGRTEANAANAVPRSKAARGCFDQAAPESHQACSSSKLPLRRCAKALKAGGGMPPLRSGRTLSD